MKFIKLTETSDKGSKPLLLNAEHISCMHKGRSGNDTYIRMALNNVDKDGKLKNEYYFVKETIEEIEGMLK